MSRGPGKIQQAVFDVLKEGEKTVGEVQWKVAESLGRVIVNPEGKVIDPTFCKSFHRAIATADESRLKSNRRPLRTIEDVVEHYPYHTHVQEVRDLRCLCLPYLKAFLKDRRLRYNDAENEMFIVRDLLRSAISTRGAANKLLLSDAHQTWKQLESEILRHVHGEARDEVLALVVRGRQIFREPPTGAEVRRLSHREYRFTGPIECSEPFAVLLAAFRQKASTPELNQLSDRLEELHESVVPMEGRHLAKLRTRLYTVLRADSSGPSRVKDEFKKFLVGKEGRKLKPYYTVDRFIGINDYRFKARLNSVVQSDVFGSFEFLIPVLKSAPSPTH